MLYEHCHQLKRSSTFIQFLALKRPVAEQFRDYLHYSPKFTVFTDNNLLIYILTSAKVNATGLRWVNELADYIKSCSEVVNQDVMDAVRCSIHETNTAQTAWSVSLRAVPDMLKEECADVPTMPLDERLVA